MIAARQGPVPVCGIVLAGGRSSRMGRDKALLPVGGKPLLRHICDELSPYCQGGLIVVAPYGVPDRYADGGILPPGAAVTVDRYADAGPLAGIHAGLMAMPVQAEWAFIMACDMPVFSAQLFRRLLAAQRGAGAASLTQAILCPGQPFHALYRRSAYAIADTHLAEGRLKLMKFIETLQPIYVDPPQDDCFLNVNSPEEYAAFVAKSGSGE